MSHKALCQSGWAFTITHTQSHTHTDTSADVAQGKRTANFDQRHGAEAPDAPGRTGRLPWSMRLGLGMRVDVGLGWLALQARNTV